MGKQLKKAVTNRKPYKRSSYHTFVTNCIFGGSKGYPSAEKKHLKRENIQDNQYASAYKYHNFFFGQLKARIIYHW